LRGRTGLLLTPWSVMSRGLNEAFRLEAQKMPPGLPGR
jgi:hypothetical protein